MSLPDHDPGAFPAGFTDPVADELLPWVVAYEPDSPDPCPPEERVAAEQHQVHVLRPMAARLCMVPGIDLRDYSKDPQQHGWGTPCSGQRATVVLEHGARVSVDVRIAELTGLIMRANERDGYIYRAADTGAYNCRHIASNPNLPWSRHAWAEAIDGNWQTNPQHRPLITDRPQWEINRWARYGFAWGGDYVAPSTPDAMHTEFMGSPDDAGEALILARRELAAPPAPGSRTLREGMTGDDVRVLQHVLNAWYPSLPALVEDGDFGPKTTDRVEYAQQRLHLVVDGVVGPVTKQLLHLP